MDEHGETQHQDEKGKRKAKVTEMEKLEVEDIEERQRRIREFVPFSSYLDLLIFARLQNHRLRNSILLPARMRLHRQR